MRIALLTDPHLSLLPEDKNGRQFTSSRTIVRAAIDQVNAWQPDLAFWLGDLTHEGTPQVRAAFNEQRARLRVPGLQIIGNHDVEVPTKAQFARDIPVIRRGIFQWSGWVVVVLDAVHELSPDDHEGVLTEADLMLLRDAVTLAAGGPLLVFSHHPPRATRCHNWPMFFEVTAEHEGVAVSIAGHSHMNRYFRGAGWHLIERSSLILYPLEWHELDLSPEALTLRPVPPDLGPLRDTAKAALADHAGDDAVTAYYGDPAAREIHIPVTHAP